MSIAQSNLAGASYGYDVVVAIAEIVINNVLKQKFLMQAAMGTLPPPVTAYYGLDDSGNVYEMEPATVLLQTKGIDPFTVPSWDGTGNVPAGVATITNAESQFYYGFKAQIGLPAGNMDDLPDILQFHSDVQSVRYNMLCHLFQFVMVNYGRQGLISYVNISQPAGQPWVFSADIPLAKMNDTANLPAIVQQQLQKLGGQFSVQKLLLEVDNPVLQESPALSGVADSNIRNKLNADFLGKYFSSVKANGLDVLNYAIVNPMPAQGLQLSDMNIYIAPIVDASGQPVSSPSTDQLNLSTVNYLCSMAGHTLPTPTPFNWNWLDSDQDLADYDGIVAINRERMIDYFQEQLTGFISANCYRSQVKVTADGLDADYSWSLTPGQPPSIERFQRSGNPVADALIIQNAELLPKEAGGPGPGTVLFFGYSSTSSDQAGLNGDIGKMILTPSITASLQFNGNTVTISQHLVIYVYVNHWSSGAGGNIIDKTITDVYDITTNGNGQLIFLKDSSRSEQIDNSQMPGVSGFLNFFNKVNELIADVGSWANAFVPTSFTDIPLSAFQQFVFPGGETFIFLDACFSANLDLVARIRMRL
jgi:hypothetical protein